MKSVLALLALAAFASAAVTPPVIPVERYSQRIMGGEPTTIENYPFAVSMLYNQRPASSFNQACGATILTSRYVLSAAHCYQSQNVYDPTSIWRIRVGSTSGTVGGTVFHVRFYTPHPGFRTFHGRDDIAVLQTNSAMVWSPSIQPAQFAGAGYIVPDDSPVIAIGYGRLSTNGPRSDTLRHVEIRAINTATCASIYPGQVSENQLCAGLLGVGGRDQCAGDSGSPVLHNNVIVGICSWGRVCGSPINPGVNTRVSSYIDWILTTIANMNLLTPDI